MIERGLLIALSLAGTLALAPAWAQDASRARFGGAFPFTIDELPPGQLRRDLLSLPPQVRTRALERLNGFEFPAADVARLRVDRSGGVYYVDPPPSVAVPAEPEGALPSGVGAAEVFALHSKPGAASVLFLDFDGAVIGGTAWNGGTADPLHARPFDSDGDESAFGADELDRIAEVWHRVAEDFAAFDVDVTTEDPGSYGPRTAHVLITPNTDALGVPMPASGSGGVAYVNVFGDPSYGYYSPAFVYSNNLSRFPPFIAEAASHEAGHNLGLSHDGTSGSAYFGGHGSGATSWGPVMGTGYGNDVSQWSKGEYLDANNPQDDIAIVGRKTGLRGDDHADTLSAATPLVVEPDGSVVSSTPETDPFGVRTANKGIIDARGDVDLFAFRAGSGPTTLTVTPSWAAWYRASNGRGTNLDVEATLYDASGSLVARADPIDETDATIALTLSAGDYYLGVRGVGNAQSPYSDYGSQGQYFVGGSIAPDDAPPPPGPEPDTTPPTPDPMSFASAPVALDDTRVRMGASVASDDSGGAVEYRFSSPTAGDSGWIGTAVWTATGLAPDTSHAWQVTARDAAGNETAPSAPATARTEAAPVAPEPPSPVGGLAAIDNADGSATLSWNDVAAESGYTIVRETYQSRRGRWSGRTEVASLPADVTSHTDASGTGRFRYLVRGTNAAGSTDGGWVEVVVTDAGSGDGSCKGGPRKCGGA